MVYSKNKRGQAAIEFLMTYGWMLLVVLIVGALIFSFVDFGSLLPNKVDLSNNLQGDPTRSIAYNNDDPTNGDLVKVVFKYTGSKRATIDPALSKVVTELKDTCTGTNVTNVDTGNSGLTGTDVPFLNSQEGIMTFDCSTITEGLLPGDSLVGKVSITTADPKTGIDIPNSGAIRLQITSN